MQLEPKTGILNSERVPLGQPAELKASVVQNFGEPQLDTVRIETRSSRFRAEVAPPVERDGKRVIDLTFVLPGGNVAGFFREDLLVSTNVRPEGFVCADGGITRIPIVGEVMNAVAQ